MEDLCVLNETYTFQPPSYKYTHSFASFTTTFHALMMGTEARVFRVLVKCPTKGPYPCSFYLPFMDLVKTFISAEDTWLWLFLSGSSGVSAPTCSHPLAQHGKVKTVAFSAPLSLDNKWRKSQVIHQHFASLVCLKRHSAVFLYVPFTIYLLLLGVTETGSHSKLSKLECPNWPGTPCLLQVGLKLAAIPLPLLPECWDYRCVPTHPAFSVHS